MSGQSEDIGPKTPWDIPSSWIWTSMGDVADVVGGGTPRTSDPANFEGGDVPWITPADLSGYRSKLIARGARNITLKGLEESGARLMPAGTVLFSSRAPIGYVAIAARPVSTNQGFKSFVLRCSLESDYVYYYLRRARDIAVELASGTTFLEISGAKAVQIPLPLAPLPEQHRIVAEIEKQFTRLDAGVAALERARANLKRYRASVLKAACEGRLVPTEAELARAEGRAYEPADRLLARILRERRAKWEADELAKMQAQGKVPKNDKWKAKYQEPTALDTTNLPELPEGWVWTTVDQLASFEPNSITDGPFGSNLKTSHYTPTGPRVIRLQNIGDGVFIDAYAHISQKHYESLAKHRIEVGNLVIATLGERPPRACVVPPSVGPAIVKADCIRFSPESRLALSRFLNYALNAEPTRARTASVVHGVGRPRLNLGEIKAITLPLPPLAEQHRIVAEVERRLSVIGELEAAVGANLKRAERLRQSILKRAFEGKLVPQDPNDEPASVLLERIREERARSNQKEKSVRKSEGRKMSKRQGKRTKVVQLEGRQSLFDVLSKAASRLTPEQLFSQAGYNPEDIEEFYEELKQEVVAKRIVQERPNDADVYLKAIGG